MIEQKLYAVPRPELAEAPSSWLARAAASQAESMVEMAAFLGFDARIDFDIQLLDVAPVHLAKCCGLPAAAFDVPYRMLDGVRSLRMKTSAMLWRRKKAIYRFCPLCMKEQVTPYFPIHWRLDAYRMCHLHHCFLEDECPHCKAPIVPQHDWMQAGSKRRGISMASQCRKCSKLLWRVDPLFVSDCAAISELERVQLENGRAFAASLLQGHVSIPYNDLTDLRMGIKAVEKARLICQGSDLGAGLMRRLRKMDASSAHYERFALSGTMYGRFRHDVLERPLRNWLDDWNTAKHVPRKGRSRRSSS